MQDNNNIDNQSKSGMKEEPHSVGSMVALFNRFYAKYEAGQGRLPATGNDRAQFGSQTALRYLKAQEQIIEETIVICKAIHRYGTVNEELKPGQRAIRFGLIFTIAADLTDKLVCLLRFARKIDLIDYEGEILLQNVHNDVPITLKLPIALIKSDLRQRLKMIKDAIKAEGGEAFENIYQTPQELATSEDEVHIPVKSFSSHQLAAQLMDFMGKDLVYQTMLHGQQKGNNAYQSTDDDNDLRKKNANPLVVIFEPTVPDSNSFLEFEAAYGNRNAPGAIDKILPQPLQSSTDVSIQEMLASQDETLHSGTLVLRNSSPLDVNDPTSTMISSHVTEGNMASHEQTLRPSTFNKTIFSTFSFVKFSQWKPDLSSSRKESYFQPAVLPQELKTSLQLQKQISKKASAEEAMSTPQQLIKTITINKRGLNTLENNKFVPVEKLIFGSDGTVLKNDALCMNMFKGVAFSKETSSSTLPKNQSQNPEEQPQGGGKSLFEISLSPRQDSGFDCYQKTDNETFSLVPAEGAWKTFEKRAADLKVSAPIAGFEETMEVPSAGMGAADCCTEIGGTKKKKKKRSTCKKIINWISKPCLGSKRDD